MQRGRKQARRTDIADALLRIAGREGIGALTMERLGREVGVTSGALFRHFPSRAAMLDEAAARAAARLEATFPAPGPPPLERLRRFIQARSRLASEQAGIPQLVWSEQFGKALPPRGARAVRGIVARTREFVAQTLRQAAARGDVRRDVPAEELALVVMGAIFAQAFFAGSGDRATARRARPAQAVWPCLARLLRPPLDASDREKE